MLLRPLRASILREASPTSPFKKKTTNKQTNKQKKGDLVFSCFLLWLTLASLSSYVLFRVTYCWWTFHKPLSTSGKTEQAEVSKIQISKFRKKLLRVIHDTLIRYSCFMTLTIFWLENESILGFWVQLLRNLVFSLGIYFLMFILPRCLWTNRENHFSNKSVN